MVPQAGGVAAAGVSAEGSGGSVELLAWRSGAVRPVVPAGEDPLSAAARPALRRCWCGVLFSVHHRPDVVVAATPDLLAGIWWLLEQQPWGENALQQSAGPQLSLGLGRDQQFRASPRIPRLSPAALPIDQIVRPPAAALWQSRRRRGPSGANLGRALADGGCQWLQWLAAPTDACRGVVRHDVQRPDDALNVSGPGRVVLDALGEGEAIVVRKLLAKRALGTGFRAEVEARSVGVVDDVGTIVLQSPGELGRRLGFQSEDPELVVAGIASSAPIFMAVFSLSLSTP